MNPGILLKRQIPIKLHGFNPLVEWKRGHCFITDVDRRYHSALVIHSSAKDRYFDVSVYCGVFRVWDGQFGRHHLRASFGLPNLRVASAAIDVRDVPYFHDGTEEGIGSSIDRIVSEVKVYAFPWFEKIKSYQFNNPLVAHGFNWIEKHKSEIHAGTEEEVRKAFRIAGAPHKARHPVLDGLLYDLRDFAFKMSVEKKDRDDIVILAFDLLSYASKNGG